MPRRHRAPDRGEHDQRRQHGAARGLRGPGDGKRPPLRLEGVPRGRLQAAARHEEVPALSVSLIGIITGAKFVRIIFILILPRVYFDVCIIVISK